MDFKKLKPGPTIEKPVTITVETWERICRASEEFLFSPGRYIDALVAHDQHLYPRERLALDYDQMVRDAFDESSDNDGDSDDTV